MLGSHRRVVEANWYGPVWVNTYNLRRLSETIALLFDDLLDLFHSEFGIHFNQCVVKKLLVLLCHLVELLLT